MGTEKLVANVTPEMRRDLKIRAAERGLNVSDAVVHALSLWYETRDNPTIRVHGAKSWASYVPAGGVQRFEAECETREVTKVQGMAQAITHWLELHPSPTERLVSQPVKRILVGNQKGGVGKTFIAAGLAQAFAEHGLRTLLVDYDPQGHLSARLQVADLPTGGDSLLKHMLGEATQHLRRSIVALEEVIPDGAEAREPQIMFDGRLHILPAHEDAFLMDAELATMRAGRDTSLRRALEPIEADYDVIVLDGPPNLGLGMDLAIDYVQRRPGELVEHSGILIPVWSDKSSFRAYNLLDKQIKTTCKNMLIEVDQLGFIVNAYDSRKGTVTRAFYEEWNSLTSPSVLAELKDSIEGRESSDYEIPLFQFAPDCVQAETLRKLAKELAA